MAEPLSGEGLRIGLVASRFNQDIVAQLIARADAERAALGVRPEDVTRTSVAGALEIPLALQWMAQSGRFDALVALGAVVRGDTYHFDVVANESARGVMDVALEFGIPVARADKGAEAVRVAVEMARLRGALTERWR